MSNPKPEFWGNIIYESAMGLYRNEQEAKEESWMEEQFFPLYTQEQVDELKKKVQMNIHNSAFNGLLKDFESIKLALEDVVLEQEHMHGCEFDNFGSEYDCKCMDRSHYNRDDVLYRAKKALKRLK